MNLVVIIDDLMPGGTEHNLLNLIRARSPDFDVQIITLFPGGGLESDFEQEYISVECLNLRPFHFFKARRKLVRLLDRLSPDAVLIQRSVARAVFPKTVKRLGLPVLMHWDNPNITVPFKTAVLEKMQVKYADCFVASSTVIGERLVEIYGLEKRAAVIHNCVNPSESFVREYRELAGRKVKIVAVGSLRREKNHLELLTTAEELLKKGMDFQIDIFGDGPLRRIIESEIEKRNLQQYVFLKGYVHDIQSVLPEYDLYLCTSVSEGFSVALIEAMAAGLPVVSYTLPFLVDFGGGKLFTTVEHGDVAAAAEAVVLLAENINERKTLGENARKAVLKDFSANYIFEQWNSLITDLTQSN